MKSATPKPQNQAAQFELEFVPYDGPAERANIFTIEFDGGSLVLRVIESRENPEPRPTLLATKRQNVEVGRFVLSPTALLSLEAAVSFAKNSYTRAMGHDLPNPAEVMKKLREVASEGR